MECRSTTKDLNSYEDLSEHFRNSLAIIEQYNVLQEGRCNLEGVFKKLTDDAENLRSSEKYLTDQLQTISKSRKNEDSIMKLYTKLKDSYSDLEKQYNLCLQDNSILQEKCLLEVNELKAVHMQEQNVIVRDFTKKLKFAESQLHEETNNFLKKESEIYNELQCAQASNALQYDEMEAKIQSLDLQLRDSIGSHNSLRQEYLNSKTQSQHDLDAANKTISELERKLRITEQQLRMNQEQLFNYDARCEVTDLQIPTKDKPVVNILKPCIVPNKLYFDPERYDALNTSHSSRKSEIANVATDTSNIPIINLNKVINPCTLPALKQLSKSGPKSSTSKKRKLWNPDK